MSILRFRIAPEYNSVYLASRDIRNAPYNFHEKIISFTPDCIGIPCIYWNDARHILRLEKPTPPTFDGILNTPDKMLVFFDVNEPKFVSLPVPTIETRIRVWIDHPRRPENVVVAWGWLET